MGDLKVWLAKRAQKDKKIYEQYGKPLENSHVGEYVAISSQGQTILGKTDVEVLQKAINTFGKSNFTLKRVGQRAFGRWLEIKK